MDRITKQNINKKTEEVNNTLNQLDLPEIYRTLHQQEKNIIIGGTWNILQDTPGVRPQNKFQCMYKDTKYVLQEQWNVVRNQ